MRRPAASAAALRFPGSSWRAARCTPRSPHRHRRPSARTPRRCMSSEWFAKPQITLEDLERRLVHIVQGEDSPVRAVALASRAHSLRDPPPEDSAAAAAAAAAGAEGPEDDGKIQLWPPRNVQDASGCTALSPTGIAQCQAVLDSERNGWLPLLHDLHPPRGVVVVSPDEACRESAEMILGKYQPNGDHFQYVELASNAAMSEKQLQGRGRAEPWDLSELLASASSSSPPTLEDYHSSGGERGQQQLRRHAIRLVHDIVVELERDALLYPFLNEPSGDSGNSVLVFGSALHNAELALLMADMLGLGWKAKRTILGAPLAQSGLLVVGGDGAQAIAPPSL